MFGLPPSPRNLEGQWFSVRVFLPLGGLYGYPADAALVGTLTTQTNPAWLDLPGAQGSRRHSPGGHKVTQASPPRAIRHTIEGEVHKTEQTQNEVRRFL